jgi:hypothetical protein
MSVQIHLDLQELLTIVVMVQQEVYRDQETAEETTVEYLDLQELILTVEEYLEVLEVLHLGEVLTGVQEQEDLVVEEELLK